MLLLKHIFYFLITITLSFSLEILQSRSAILTSDKPAEDLIEIYRHDLYQSNKSSHIIPAQALLALFEQTRNHTAIDILGDFYYEQMGDQDLGAELYQHGASHKSPHCLFKLARHKLASENSDEALDHLLVGARLFDNYCLCMLAQKILDGTFKDRPHAEAKKYLIIAAQQGFTVAITELAKYLTDTKYGQPHYLLAYSLLSTIPDDNRARQQLDRLKDNEVVQAYLHRDYIKLAKFYSTGQKAPLNIDLAISLIQASTLSTKDKKDRIRQIKSQLPLIY